MKNQFLSLVLVFLMGYFGGNVVKDIRPAAYSVFNKIEALVVSNISNKNIAKDLQKEHKALVVDNKVALFNVMTSNTFFSKSNKLFYHNPLNEELLSSTVEFFSFVTSKLTDTRGSPKDILNNTS